MIVVDRVESCGLEHAIRGMRNPMNSWDKSDSYMCDAAHCCACPRCTEERDCSRPDGYVVGPNDLELMRKLYRAGTEHRKFMRQIMVSMDVIAPLYWWKEFDQYKIGVTTNGCSTMHKIHAKKFTLDDFSHEHLLEDEAMEFMKHLVNGLNFYRQAYLDTKNKDYWWQMIQLLPSSYNQRRTITLNYEVAATMIKQRTGHKLDEWNEFVKVLKKLPHMVEIINQEGEG